MYLAEATDTNSSIYVIGNRKMNNVFFFINKMITFVENVSPVHTSNENEHSS